MQPGGGDDKDLSHLLGDLAKLSFSSSATNSNHEWDEHVNEKREKAQQAMSAFGQEQQMSNEEKFGLPRNNQEAFSLLVEVSLLPNPRLASVQAGRANGESVAASFEQSGRAVGELLQHPLAKEYLRRHPTLLADALSDSALKALAREQERHWEQIPWLKDAEDAKLLSLDCQKPLLVEIVVGRLADATESSLC